MLQNPTDRAITKFNGKQTYNDFLTNLADLQSYLPQRTKIYYKAHPLSPQSFAKNAVSVGSMDINSFVSQVDLLITFTSGVGVIGMLYETPVIAAGEAFYATALSRTIEDIWQRRDRLFASLSDLEKQKIKRYINYLWHNYYSHTEFDHVFGKLIGVRPKNLKIWTGSESVSIPVKYHATSILGNLWWLTKRIMRNKVIS